MKALESLQFDNTYSRLPEAFHRRVRPTPLPKPYLVSFNSAVSEMIGLDPKEVEKQEFLEFFTGNRLFPGSEPISAIYAGHQFGVWVPQLGDGRAILLGEVVNGEGRRFDIQLKGAGMTPFSRMGDGRAVLRSTIREYLCSEAMHALGIPTTRALCITGSDAPVYREQVETAAVLTRVAPTHVRFGTFELFASRRQVEQVKQLADYVISEHYPHLVDHDVKYLQFLREVVERTAVMLARWQAVGFSHGVMNTDNMSVTGLTIDYGPFGFLDEFDPSFICNHSDHGGRYAYHQQPNIGLWNLGCFAQTLLSLIDRDEAISALDEYESIFLAEYFRLMRAKLGLFEQFDEDSELISDLLLQMQQSAADYTLFFRRMCDFDFTPGEQNWDLKGMLVDPAGFDKWAARYSERIACEPIADRAVRMKKINPKFILRNHIAQLAIEKAEAGDYSEVDKLLKLLQNPFNENPESDLYSQPPAIGTPKVVVSCSS